MQPFLVAFLVLCAYGFQNASFYVKVRFSDASFRIWGKIGFADYIMSKSIKIYGREIQYISSSIKKIKKCSYFNI